MSDHQLKLEWASKQFDSLKSAFSQFVNSHPYETVRNFDPQSGEHYATVIRGDTDMSEWSLRVGDIVHNLRSALDNLVFELAVKESGHHPAICDLTLQFPIADHPNGWFDPRKKKGKRDCVSLLSLDAQAVIEGLQPCKRSDKTTPHKLSVLRDLSNWDKHKHIAVTLMAASESSIEITGEGIPPGTVIPGFSGVLDRETVISRWKFAQPDGVTTVRMVEPANMKVQCNLGLHILFGAGTPVPRRDVFHILDALIRHVAVEVFPPLDALL